MHQKKTSLKLLSMDFFKFLLIDVFTSTVLGFIIWFVTKDTSTSLIISLITGIIFLIVEIRFQLISVKEEIIDAVGIQVEAAKDEFLVTIVQKMIDDYYGICLEKDALFLKYAQDAMSGCIERLGQLREGQMPVSREEVYELDIALWDTVRISAFAMDFLNTSSYWTRGGGQKVLQKNEEAIARGVKITRVFILHNVDEITSDIKILIDLQAKKGIDVKVAIVDDLAQDLLQDMVVFDDKYVTYSDIVWGSSEMRGGKIFRSEAKLREAATIRNRILLECRDPKEFFQSQG